MHVCLFAREALFLSQSMVNGSSRIIWTFAYQFSFYVGIDLMFICIHIYTHTCIYMHAHGYFYAWSVLKVNIPYSVKI